MNYLSHSILKASLYLLCGKGSLLLSDFKYLERQDLIDDIFSNKLEDLFVLKNSAGAAENFNFKKISDYPYDISPGIKTLELVLPDSDKEKLLGFINTYINAFKNGSIDSLTDNYLPYNESYKASIELLKPFKNYGKKISFKLALNDKSPFTFFKSDIRFLDILFYFILQKFIRINIGDIYKVMHKTAEDYYEEEILMPVTILFDKTLDEISDIEGAWISYGSDIKLNLLEHIAYYKNNIYKFKSTDTKSFKLLKMLIESHGKPILIADAYSELDPSDKYKSEYFEEKKETVVNLIKDLKKKLKITKDKSPTVKISIAGKEFYLTASKA